ncbi:MAG: ParB/RepB/Spo0J family partition protein, partial [Methylobacter sp.]
YEIIAGERRWRAARLAGLNEVPVLIRDVPDEAALAMSLIENIQRENLNPLEEAHGIQRLVNEFGMTHEKAAAAVGRSRSAVSNLLRLLNLAAPVQELLTQSKLEMGHARALLPLPGAAQIQAGQEISAKQLSVREAEHLVKRLLAPPPPPSKKPDRDVLHLQENLAEKIGAKVTLKTGNRGAGKLIIDYGSLEQLDNIIAKFFEHV